MSPVSAGLLMFRDLDGTLVYLLVHPGGPFFRNKDVGSWTIPKGLALDHEELLSAAQREFTEETGIVPEGPFLALGKIKQKGGKTVYCWGFKCPDSYYYWDPERDLKSNTFTMTWPPRSGKTQSFPEVDRAGWFNFQDACLKINQAQVDFLEQLQKVVKG